MSKLAKKATVARDEYLQLMGLLVLAKKHQAIMDDLEESVREITGEEGASGHSSDAVFDHHDADELLRKLGLGVKDPGEETK